MKKPSLAIITEGGVSLGLGHVQRMLTLAKALDRRFEISFLTRSEEGVRNKISASGFRIISTEDYRLALQALNCLQIVIIDRLHVEEDLARWIRCETSARLVIFGNTSSANAFAHVVVNAILGTRFENRRYVDTGGTEYLEGPRYVLLREEFRKSRNQHPRRAVLRRVLLLFGGSDQANLTGRAVNALRTSSIPFEITACVGALFPYLVELEALRSDAERAGRPFAIKKNVSDVCRLMFEADAVVTSPGGALFEAMMLGAPVLAFCQNAFQSEMFEGFPMVYAQSEIHDLDSRLRNSFANAAINREITARFEVGEGFDNLLAAVQGCPPSASAQLGDQVYE